MLQPVDPAVRLKAIAAAQGKEPFDLLLTGARVLDVATLELREADVGIVGPMVVSVHPCGRFAAARETHDLSGLILVPGFIDAHVHFESSHMLPHHYASVVVPQGTTTIFCDPHELANVLGIEGVRFAVEATRGLPLRFIVQAPSCVPAAPGLELAGADFQAAEIRELLSWPEIAGLAEVMDMRAVLEGQPRMAGILREAIASGKIVEGHARGLTGEGLQAYLSAGILGDHEITSGADALEKLRAGLTVEIRGSHDYLLPDVITAINTLPVIPTSLTVCTDDVFPDYLCDKGGVSDVLRRLIRYGLDPLQAIRCATTFSTASRRPFDHNERPRRPPAVRGHDPDGFVPAVPGAADHRQADPALVRRIGGRLDHLHGVLSGGIADRLCLRRCEHPLAQAARAGGAPLHAGGSESGRTAHHSQRRMETPR